MTKPRLLILSFSPIASDARVLKQIELFRSEYEVTTCGYGPPVEGTAGHIEIPAQLQVWQYPRLLVVLRRYRRAYWGNAAISYAREALSGRSFDVVLANDVDAVGLALAVQPDGAVHADLHEYSPRQHEELLRFRVFVRPFVEWMCRRFVARAASWSTVSGGLAREYRRRFGFDAEVVTNAAPYVPAEPTPVSTPIRLVHSGAALRNRDLASTIRAVQASTADVTLDLFVTPNEPDYVAELRELAAATPDRVRVNDPVPYAELAATLRRFDVGIFILAPTNFNYRWALPNKLFDYVQARLGVIVGPSPEMAEYVRRYGLGVVTADFQAPALTDAVDAMTVADVARWKAGAASSAHELSSEQQVLRWKRAVDALAAREAR